MQVRPPAKHLERPGPARRHEARGRIPWGAMARRPGRRSRERGGGRGGGRAVGRRRRGSREGSMASGAGQSGGARKGTRERWGDVLGRARVAQGALELAYGGLSAG